MQECILLVLRQFGEATGLKMHNINTVLVYGLNAVHRTKKLAKYREMRPKKLFN